VRDALINGSADIGAVPTNLAAALYNATKGEILLLALNTKGVLYLVTNANVEAPASLADLAGKMVYCPTQNPAFITKALLCDIFQDFFHNRVFLFHINHDFEEKILQL
jgi:ABC-type nitrate/sulfonate/bicarbonate transport system substrate-binding protein